MPPYQSTIVPYSRIALVGEAPGAEEEKLGRPFVGASGQELTAMLHQAGLDINECSLLNVFNERPEANDITKFCQPKKLCPKGYDLPPLRAGKYFIPTLANRNLSRLSAELKSLRPNVCIALGNTACWALLRYAGISSLRGTTAESSLVGGLKVLPTYHPAAVLREWELRPIVVADLIKAEKERHFPEIIRPQRSIWINPSLEDLDEFYLRFITKSPRISIDIETGHGLIKCVGIATDAHTAIVVPFIDRGQAGYSYWSTAEQERKAWTWLKLVMSEPRDQVFQNGMYDIQWLWRKVGLTPGGTFQDTMLMHHALQPEMKKSLGFLGSIYTNESSWKLMHRKSETTKREE